MSSSAYDMEVTGVIYRVAADYTTAKNYYLRHNIFVFVYLCM